MYKNITKILQFLPKLIYIVLLFVSVWFIYGILKLNVIPLKYIIIFFSIYGVILLGLGLLTFKKFKIFIKILSNLISILIITLMFIINNYVIHTDKFLDNIREKDYIYLNYYAFVLNENKDKDIASFESIGIYESDENYNKALDDIKSQYSLETNMYEDFVSLSDALIQGKEDLILLGETERGFIMDTVEEYETDMFMLMTVSVKLENDVKTVETTLTDYPFNVYISGIDTKGSISAVSRSDVNMIATVNPNTNQILLTSIPRDYYVELYGKGSKDKLTHSGVYGINTSIKTVENLLDTEVNYYFKVNFSTVIELVDIIGGVDVYSDKSFTAYTSPSCHVVEGMNHFDGKCALAFARERFAYKTGDHHRIKNQQDVLMAIFNKVATSKDILVKYEEILNILEDSIQTNMPKEKIYQMAKQQLDTMPTWEFSNYYLKGSNASSYTYSYPTRKLYVMKPDYSTVEEAKNKINELLNK